MILSDKIQQYFRRILSRKGKYRQVHDEQNVPLNPGKWEERPIFHASNRYGPYNGKALSIKPPVSLLCTSAVVFATSLLLRGFIKEYMPIDRACTERFSPWAPSLDAVSYEWTQYDSANLNTDYAGPPTQERESKWLQQYEYGFVPYPIDKIDLLNKTADGDWWIYDGNLVTLSEWIHQIHCTYLLREWIYRDQFDYSGFTNTSSGAFHIHKNHCFLILKQMIECKADATPVLFARDPSGLGAWRTYDAPKKCRRNEELAAFTEDNLLCDMECEPEHLEPV